MEKASSQRKGANGKKAEVDVASVLKQLPSDDTLSWDSYFAPEHLKDELMHLAECMNPDFQRRLKALREHCRARPSQIFRGRKMILLHGPPGTGKTHAMRMLASLLNLQPWVLDVKAMADSWEARSLFDEVLQTIGSLSRSIVFLDECEGIFRSRGPMMNYASVTVTTKVELIDDFLTWVDGLQGQKESHVMAGAFLCLSTNVLEHIDPAVVSRSSCLKIDLPGLPERQAWWAAHAKHLVMPELAELASITEGLSFRDLAQVAEKVERAAARHAGLDAQVKHCSISQYRDVSRKLAEDKGSADTATSQEHLAKTGGWLAALQAEHAERQKLEARVKQLEESLDAGYCYIEDSQIHQIREKTWPQETEVEGPLRGYVRPLLRKFRVVSDSILK
ncbi:ftsH2 [Symbiodinium natans]|uniref:FtsH2 protein n=1 Tax=Symbiodinium natans TaxID=878477 RepID=A0A812I4S9_9DINO|nr:ftsH2 [Symbiodinium natans]